MLSTAENITTSNLTVFSGHYNLSFCRDCEKQEHKIALSVRTFHHYRPTETFNGEQRKLLVAGVERSGHLQSIMAGHLIGTGVLAYDYKWPHAPRFMPGYCLNELSSSGAKKEGISRMWSAVRNGTLEMLTTSDITSPLSMIVMGQDKGININWEEIDKRYPENSSNELEGFRPGKNFKSTIDFYKTYPWVNNTEDLVIELSDRKKSLGGLDESSGVALAGNLSECSGDWLNKLRVVTYQNCKNNLSEKNISSEFHRLLEESARELRGSFSHVLDQKDKLGAICEDTFDKEYVFFVGTGEDSGKKAKASQMRGEHAKMKNVIHIDSENEPSIKNRIESFSSDYIKKNVRAIALSESLKSPSKRTIQFLQSKGVITYGITANNENKIVKEHPERWVVIPNQSVHVLESTNVFPPENLRNPKSPPKVHISSFQYSLLPTSDCITSYWVVKNKSRVSERHKTGE